MIARWKNKHKGSGEDFVREIGWITAAHVEQLSAVWARFRPSKMKNSRRWWSHFHAALEWDDAAASLKKANSEGLSVSEMRRERWQCLDS
ncbi:MAG: hypothetical protein H8E66_20685 [Planctomycetes bacterium]|nr:hypothetical protein [Planctomycetota bacterium]